MKSIKKILFKIQDFENFFSEKYVYWKYAKAWELNRRHGITLNPLSPFSAFILKCLVRRQRAKTILEIGTSGGYSAITMAYATRQHAHIYTIEKSAPKAEIARIHFAESELKNVTLIEDDAMEVIKKWDKKIDVLFLDADKKNYTKFLQALEKHLSPDALVIADNVKSHPHEVTEFIHYMKNSSDYKTYIIPFSKGLLVAKRNK